MPDERNYYVLCDDNCKFEGMTKEQIIEAIEEATGETPTHIDDAFITKIKEKNHSASLSFWVGTTAEYNALSTKAQNTFYILTDEDYDDAIGGLRQDVDELQQTIENILDGTQKVPAAELADKSVALTNAQKVPYDVGGLKAPVFFVNGHPSACRALYMHYIEVMKSQADLYLHLIAYTSTETEINTVSLLHTALDIDTNRQLIHPCTGMMNVNDEIMIVFGLQPGQPTLINVHGYIPASGDYSHSYIPADANVYDRKVDRIR